MLLRLGFVMMALAAVLTGVVVAVVLMDEPAQSAAVKSAKEPATEPLKRVDPQVEAWQEKALPDSSPQEPRPEPTKEPERRPEPTPEPVPQAEPQPEAEPRPESEPAPEEPPEPTQEDIASAHRPRHYELPDGAVMGLTVKALDIYNVPVFDSVDASALKYGLGHLPGSSMPWTDAPQRNVYLAGHRLGFPGTYSHLVFYRLNDLEDGDEILLRDRDGTKYTYRVTETFKASPEDSWVTGQVRNRDMVTLQTCSGPNWERRLIVRADRG